MVNYHKIWYIYNYLVIYYYTFYHNTGHLRTNHYKCTSCHEYPSPVTAAMSTSHHLSPVTAAMSTYDWCLV